MAHKKREYAVEKLTNALQSIAVYEDQIPIVLYGNCYVIYKDIEGTIWKQQPKHFATIELGQRTKLVVLDDRLFQLVSCLSMCIYNVDRACMRHIIMSCSILFRSLHYSS